MDKLTDLERIVIRIEGKVDTILKVKNDHENRIRFLEKYAWLLLGGIGLITVLINLFIR